MIRITVETLNADGEVASVDGVVTVWEPVAHNATEFIVYDRDNPGYQGQTFGFSENLDPWYVLLEIVAQQMREAASARA
jgi:hypothetical protein